MFGNNKADFDLSKDVIVAENENEFFLKIKQRINQYLEKGRPVLVFFKD